MRIGTFVLLIFPFAGLCQAGMVELRNPSFEAPPDGTISQWANCGFEGQSTPDVQPGKFGCAVKPMEGKTYLGMVTRANNTWERVCQKLTKPLLKDTVYQFAICLAASPDYWSATHDSDVKANYNAAVKLRVWGDNISKNEMELLAETPVLTHEYWKHYTIKIQALEFDIDKIVLEACYSDPEIKSAGNLLLDNATNFFPASLSKEFEDLREKRLMIEANDKIEIYNPSFETRTFELYMFPVGWSDKNSILKTHFRTHPPYTVVKKKNSTTKITSEEGTVLLEENRQITRIKAFDGDSYGSLLTANDGRRQALSQFLEGAMTKGTEYLFSIQLAKSKHFREKEIGSNKNIDFAGPLRLLIWGGNEDNPKAELLATSPIIEKQEWQKAQFVLSPAENNYTVMTLEADFAPEIGKAYYGNILLDNCSSIVKISK
ncbi:MAG: hypothetical protein ACKVT2_03250 [Saprospiraceae bacterium]